MALIKEKRVIYLPVISGKGGYMSSSRVDRSYKGQDLGWWMPNPLDSYDTVLMSAYYGISSINSREDLKMRDDVVFFGDSGGFQIFNLGWDNPTRRKELQDMLKPSKIIAWQQKCCDIGMTLDLPLPDFHKYSEKEFQYNLSISKEQGDEMRSLQDTSKDFQLFSVVHGRDLNDLTRWWERSIEDHDFDGFSLDAGNVRTVAMDLGFAIENLDHAPFHILGASGFQALPLMVYANKFMKTQLYFDSSTYNTGNTLRKYMNFFDLASTGFMFGDGKVPKDPNIRKPIRLNQNFCPCPICRSMDNVSDLWSKGTLSGTLLSLHNLFWFKTYTAYLEDILDNDEAFFMEFVRRNSTKQTMMYMDFLTMTAEDGLDAAWTKYFDKNTAKLETWY